MAILGVDEDFNVFVEVSGERNLYPDLKEGWDRDGFFLGDGTPVRSAWVCPPMPENFAAPDLGEKLRQIEEQTKIHNEKLSRAVFRIFRGANWMAAWVIEPRPGAPWDECEVVQSRAAEWNERTPSVQPQPPYTDLAVALEKAKARHNAQAWEKAHGKYSLGELGDRWIAEHGIVCSEQITKICFEID